MFKGSVWQIENEIPWREPLSRNIVTEVAVIGAGLAGILIADRLRSMGKKVVVLEADRIAGGQTGKTTAKITAQHGCVFAGFAENFGIDKARLYAKANIDAVEWYRKCVNERKIDCDFKDVDSFIYSFTEQEKLKREAEVCKKIGLKAEFVTETELPFKVAGAVKLPNQAQFDPLKFIKTVSADITIYENTPVKTVKGNTVYCENCTVRAEHIVFACHYPFLILSGFYFAKMYQQRSYVLALQAEHVINGMYVGIDSEGYSFRRYRDMLLLGGGGHRTGENSTGGKYDLLRTAANRLLKGSTEVAAWSAQDCITADGMPYIGRLSLCHPNWYVATGFGKWGMTTSAVAADIISDLICGRHNEYVKVFSPQRCSLKAAGGVAKEMGQAVKGLVRGNFTVPPHLLSSIRVGDGGIVSMDGKRVGVYRESDKKFYTVIPRCTHMGCGLEWNPDEKSWDCPCHGSRFDYKGNLIDNPAKKELQHPPEL